MTVNINELKFKVKVDPESLRKYEKAIKRLMDYQIDYQTSQAMITGGCMKSGQDFASGVTLGIHQNCSCTVPIGNRRNMAEPTTFFEEQLKVEVDNTLAGLDSWYLKKQPISSHQNCRCINHTRTDISEETKEKIYDTLQKQMDKHIEEQFYRTCVVKDFECIPNYKYATEHPQPRTKAYSTPSGETIVETPDGLICYPPKTPYKTPKPGEGTNNMKSNFYLVALVKETEKSTEVLVEPKFILAESAEEAKVEILRETPASVPSKEVRPLVRAMF